MRFLKGFISPLMNTQIRLHVMDTEHFLACKKFAHNSILDAHVCGSCMIATADDNLQIPKIFMLEKLWTNTF